jgi:hypothetical protein
MTTTPDDSDPNAALPAAALIDPERSDLQDPLAQLIAAEQSPPDEEPAMATKATKRSSRTPRPPTLPPLAADGVAQHTEPRSDPPPAAERPVLGADGTSLPAPADERRHNVASHRVAWPDDERPARLIEMGLATKDYIAHAGDAAAAALAPAATSSMLLYNVIDYIDELEPLSPIGAYLARNAISMSLGFAVISQLRRELRNANQPQAPAADIDVLGKYQALFDQERERDRTEELGYVALPPFDAKPLAGVYMHMLYEQRATFQFADRWPVRMPHEILHQIQEGGPNAGLAEAYHALQLQVLGPDNPALGRIMADKARIAAVRSEQDKVAFAAERAYVLQTLQDTRPEPLTDEVWHEIPLYMQYRFSTMAFNQVCKATSVESLSRDVDYTRLGQLGQVAAHMCLEIEAAFKTAEVQAAFEQKRLDSRHDIRVALPTTPPAPAAPTMRRAPPPTPEELQARKPAPD